MIHQGFVSIQHVKISKARQLRFDAVLKIVA